MENLRTDRLGLLVDQLDRAHEMSRARVDTQGVRPGRMGA
jgi:hypothetical protein